MSAVRTFQDPEVRALMDEATELYDQAREIWAQAYATEQRARALVGTVRIAPMAGFALGTPQEAEVVAAVVPG